MFIAACTYFIGGCKWRVALAPLKARHTSPACQVKRSPALTLMLAFLSAAPPSRSLSRKNSPRSFLDSSLTSSLWGLVQHPLTESQGQPKDLLLCCIGVERFNKLTNKWLQIFFMSVLQIAKNQTGQCDPLRFTMMLKVEEARPVRWTNSFGKSQATTVFFPSSYLPSFRFIWPEQVPAAAQDGGGMQAETVAL